MTKKPERTPGEIIAGLMSKPQVPCSAIEALHVSLWANNQRNGGAADVKSKLRLHVEHFKQRSVLLRETADAATNPKARHGFVGSAFAWDNAANLLNAELNRP